MAADRRETLRRRLKSALREIETAAERQTGHAIQDEIRQSRVTGRRVEDEQRRAEAARVSRQLQEAGELRRAGRIGEANRLADEIAARNPDNPAAIAARRTTGLNDRLADARVRRLERDDAFLGVGKDIERSSLPAAGDIELPRDWREKSARRSAGPKLTEQEKKILRVLDTSIEVDVEGTFGQVIDYLETRMGLTLLVDRQALTEVGINYDSPVALKVKRATARTVLRKLFSDLGLAYIIKDQSIQVTSLARARDTMTTRAYYVGDLAPVTDIRFGPFLSQLAAAQAISAMVYYIQQNIDPGSWQPNGPGSIVFDPISMSIVVRQSAEVHMMLGNSLR
jgi:hypothetical protein